MSSSEKSDSGYEHQSPCVDDTNALTDKAFGAGRDAAQAYFREGKTARPALVGLPLSLTQVLKGDGERPSVVEMETVAGEWTRGVNDAWIGA